MSRRPQSTSLLILAASLLISACSVEIEPPSSSSAATATSGSSLWPTKTIEAQPPYIVQEGCKFFLVTAAGTISTTSERDSGPSGNATLDMGGERMVLSNCTLAENPGKLPVF